MLTNKPGRLGDLKKFQVLADGVDITNAVIQTHIWQDIYTPSWSAQLGLQDTNNMIHTVPLKQGTEIIIKIETELPSPDTDGSKEYKLRLYKITDRVLRKSMHQAYVLHLVSNEFMKNQTKRVQKHFDKKPDEIVQEVVSEHIGGSVETVGATNKVNVIVPNMSPFVCAQWMSKIALNAGNADYVFFMKDEGKFVFAPVRMLFESKKYSTGLKFVQRIADMREADAAIPEDRILAVKGFSIEHWDGMANLVGGFFGSQTCWYDFMEKKWDKKDHTHESMTGKFSDDPSKVNISFVPKHDKLFDGPNIFETAKEWGGSRKHSTMLLDQDRVFVQLPGGAKYWEFVGKNCELDLSSQEDMSGEEFDKYYRGKYLIASVHHVIDDMVYSVNLELVKIKLEKAM